MNNSRNLILVTGVAGFIGAALAKQLLKIGENVLGIDNLNDYYDINLKKSRLADIDKHALKSEGSWQFKICDIKDKKKLYKIASNPRPNIVINLAAQAGVRYSISNPGEYVSNNILGFGNILDLSKDYKVKNLIYASSSSVYGGNKKLPYFEDQLVDHPVSIYAATKKTNELLAHSYSHIYNLPSTGLRFFTVYGPWGRPDMAPMIFTKSIIQEKKINVFNYGEMMRDFTYIDDIVEGVIRCCYKPAIPNDKFNFLNPEASNSFAPHRIFNIGNSSPVRILKFLEILENIIGKKARIDLKPIEPGDVISTFADTNKLKDWIGFSPQTNLKKGLEIFVDWYRNYYKI